MDTTKKKTSAKSGGVDNRTPLFFRELQEKARSSNVDCYIHPAVLNSQPKPGHATWNTYLTDKWSLIVNLANIFDNVIKVYVAFQNFEKTGSITRVYINQQEICSNFVNSLCNVLQKYDHVTTIKLEHCNATKAMIEELSKGLLEMPNVNEISLDGNPIEQQNHGLIANNENLLILSLKYCKINDVGCEVLSTNINKQLNSKLQILNLTGNHIDDNGTPHLQKILRQNRSLNVLILADNWITDLGCIHLVNALLPFTLNKDDIKIVRMINLYYYKERERLVEQYKAERINDEMYLNSKKLPKRKTPTKSAKQQSQPNARDITLMQEIEELNRQNLFLEKSIEKRTHHFITDVSEINGEKLCFGNLSLEFLNLAFNKIRTTGYKQIIEMLNYQLSTEYKGLLYIVLNGNYDIHSFEFDEVSRLVLEKQWKHQETSNHNLETFDATSATNRNTSAPSTAVS